MFYSWGGNCLWCPSVKGNPSIFWGRGEALTLQTSDGAQQEYPVI